MNASPGSPSAALKRSARRGVLARPRAPLSRRRTDGPLPEQTVLTAPHPGFRDQGWPAVLTAGSDQQPVVVPADGNLARGLPGHRSANPTGSGLFFTRPGAPFRTETCSRGHRSRLPQQDASSCAPSLKTGWAKHTRPFRGGSIGPLCPRKGGSEAALIRQASGGRPPCPLRLRDVWPRRHGVDRRVKPDDDGGVRYRRHPTPDLRSDPPPQRGGLGSAGSDSFFPASCVGGALQRGATVPPPSPARGSGFRLWRPRNDKGRACSNGRADEQAAPACRSGACASKNPEPRREGTATGPPSPVRGSGFRLTAAPERRGQRRATSRALPGKTSGRALFPRGRCP